MGEAREEVSLEAVVQRLEALERENERMRQENENLRGKVTTLEGSAAPKEKPHTIEKHDGVAEERVSRKVLLVKAGAAAVAVAAAGTMLTPREAKAAQVSGDGNPGVKGTGTSNEAVGVKGDLQVGVASGTGVQGFGRGEFRSGVYGENGSDGGRGVYGSGTGAGVFGLSLGGDGVQGQSAENGFSGVYGNHNDFSEGYGVLGEGKGTEFAGVKGTNDTGAGVIGESKNTGYEGVYGKHTGTFGFGVVGDGTGATAAGVFGRNFSGYGGLFEGGKAQLKLTPHSGTGRPKSGSHQKGEIYLDSGGALFVCTKSGNPGTWKKFTTTSA